MASSYSDYQSAVFELGLKLTLARSSYKAELAKWDNGLISDAQMQELNTQWQAYMLKIEYHCTRISQHFNMPLSVVRSSVLGVQVK
jgi:hypothetical protein